MNLIVTCARNLEGEAEEEIIDILDELGILTLKFLLAICLELLLFKQNWIP